MPKKKHSLGQHFTPDNIVEKYDSYFKDVFQRDLNIVDPFVGEGHLLIAFLDNLTFSDAVAYLKRGKVKGYDCDLKVLRELRKKFKIKYGLDDELLETIFRQNNSLLNNRTLKTDIIITNPPYLARNTCKMKHKKDYKRNFSKNNYHDYYEIALRKYLKNEGLWILPSNIYSNMKLHDLRKDIFEKLNLESLYVYESPVFKTTRISVTSFIMKKKTFEQNILTFNFVNNFSEKKLDIDILNGEICSEWNKIVHKKKTTIESVDHGFLREDLVSGSEEVCLLNENYEKEIFLLSKDIASAIRSNHLILRTVDTGSTGGELGLYELSDIFPEKFSSKPVPEGLITKKTSRLYTQIRFKKEMSKIQQLKIKQDFNENVLYFRKKTNLVMVTNFKNTTGKGLSRKRLGFFESLSLIKFQMLKLPI